MRDIDEQRQFQHRCIDAAVPPCPTCVPKPRFQNRSNGCKTFDITYDDEDDDDDDYFPTVPEAPVDDATHPPGDYPGGAEPVAGFEVANMSHFDAAVRLHFQYPRQH